MLARYPRLGEVKTRLVPPLTAEEALALHDALARHTLRALLAVQATGDARAEVRTDAAFARVAFDWLGHGYKARYQGEGDLGDRIRLAFGESFGRGAHRVVVVGSDCPSLSAQHIRGRWTGSTASTWCSARRKTAATIWWHFEARARNARCRRCSRA